MLVLVLVLVLMLVLVEQLSLPLPAVRSTRLKQMTCKGFAGDGSGSGIKVDTASQSMHCGATSDRDRGVTQSINP